MQSLFRLISRAWYRLEQLLNGHLQPTDASYLPLSSLAAVGTLMLGISCITYYLKGGLFVLEKLEDVAARRYGDGCERKTLWKRSDQGNRPRAASYSSGSEEELDAPGDRSDESVAGDVELEEFGVTRRHGSGPFSA